MTNTSNLTIAVIEDDCNFACVVGHTLPCSVSCYKEVSHFTDVGFDAVITDLRLKETYGVETIRKLREKTNAPIIVLTGLGGSFLSATDMQLFLEAGADEVFQKEALTDPAFFDMIKQVINKRAAA